MHETCPNLRALVQVHREVGAAASQPDKELSVATVDKALDDIRGYLFADGGDITVVDVSDGEVFVRFEGACSTCSSQETTMAMGVERALRGAFGDQLKAVTQVEEDPAAAAGPAAPPLADEAAIEGLLALLRPAVENYGGSMSVAEIAGEVCRIQYDGPDAIWTGVRMAISDKFGETLTKIERV